MKPSPDVATLASAKAGDKKTSDEARLGRAYGAFTLGLIAFALLLGGFEHLGMSRNAIGLWFLFATVGLYAGIGIMSRTTNAAEYYVAGRRVPAMYNGMATAADWMSAASFIGMAGTLYLNGYGGLAFVMGWTGGYCLVALLLAPYLRQHGQFTIPDFLGDRYGSHTVRILGACAALLCSFTYLVAQIYGVGLVTARLTGIAFEIGIFVGLGGILMCSFLGGMRAITWTQVAQYIILVLAYLVPVVWLSVKQTGFPVPQLIYGMQLQKVTEKELALLGDPSEIEVIGLYKKRAQDLDTKLRQVETTLATDKLELAKRVLQLQESGAPPTQLAEARRLLASLPKTPEMAAKVWGAARDAALARAAPLGGMPHHAQAFAGKPNGDATEKSTFDTSRRNFIALVFCLMLGTASLPHILARCYTTPSVAQARQSVTWSLVFIFLLYFTAPALAVLVKFEVLNVLVGTEFSQLPAWIAQWSKVDPGLVMVSDINHDGILQLGEIRLSPDIIMLATPEIGGMPFVVSGLVAAGGLAAALSTADGLLLTISTALSHDVYYKIVDPNAGEMRRVMVSKVLVMLVALVAAYVAALRPADTVLLVTAAFSLAAAGFFPVLVLGIFWKRANCWGAMAGMVSGLCVTGYYMLMHQSWSAGRPWIHNVLGTAAPLEPWWGILPISAGVFGVPVGFATIAIVSLLTPKPPEGSNALVERIRRPDQFATTKPEAP